MCASVDPDLEPTNDRRNLTGFHGLSDPNAILKPLQQCSFLHKRKK